MIILSADRKSGPVRYPAYFTMIRSGPVYNYNGTFYQKSCPVRPPRRIAILDPVRSGSTKKADPVGF